MLGGGGGIMQPDQAKNAFFEKYPWFQVYILLV
jgi:hypothetical protein